MRPVMDAALRPAAAALTAALLAACGPGGEIVAVEVVHNRDATGRGIIRASAIHVDADGAAWQATHAAGVSVSVAPDDRLARGACDVVEGGPRGSDFAAFRAYDLGAVTVTRGNASFSLSPVDVWGGEGTGFVGDADVALMNYEPGEFYVVRGEGSEVSPPFGAQILAPTDFSVDRVGRSNAGSATITIPRRSDLEITWSPSGSDADMVIALEVFDGRGVGLVCRVADDGRFTIRSRHLREMPAQNGFLVLERYYDARFDTNDASDGRARKGRIRFGVQRQHRISLQ